MLIIFPISGGWAGCVLIIKNNFLFWDVLSIYSLNPSHWHLWKLQMCTVFPSALLFASLSGMVSLFHLHLPRPISSRSLLWPKPDGSAQDISFISLLTLTSLGLYYWGLCICISSPLSSSLGVWGGILFLYPWFLARSLAHNTYWDEMTRGTRWVKESPTWMTEKADFDLVKTFGHL